MVKDMSTQEGYDFMSQKSKWDYLKAIYSRYQKVSKTAPSSHSRRVLPGLRLQPTLFCGST